MFTLFHFNAQFLPSLFANKKIICCFKCQRLFEQKQTVTIKQKMNFK
jgi:hypothetical protein